MHQVALPGLVEPFIRFRNLIAFKRFNRLDKFRQRQLAWKCPHTFPGCIIRFTKEVVQRAKRPIDRGHDRTIRSALCQQPQEVDEGLRITLVEHQANRLGSKVRDLIFIDDVAAWRNTQLQRERSHDGAVETIERTNLQSVQVVGELKKQVERFVTRER